jgi:hypothetical protein
VARARRRGRGLLLVGATPAPRSARDDRDGRRWCTDHRNQARWTGRTSSRLSRVSRPTPSRSTVHTVGSTSSGPRGEPAPGTALQYPGLRPSARRDPSRQLSS